ncbi:MAG: oxidoreductase, partial [Muribaculaceae bacterium]|nr:oxidoreductase [Muribaculaceae bacterium]
VTDIRPGFVDTALLDPTRHYPMKMSLDYVALRIEHAMLTARRVAVVDSRWAVVTALWRLIPNALWNRISLEM